MKLSTFIKIIGITVFLFLFANSAFAVTAAVTVDEDINLYLSTPNITLVLKAGSAIDSITVTATTVTISVPPGASANIVSPQRYLLTNDQNIAISCPQAEARLNILGGAAGLIVNITPQANQFCAAIVGGGGAGPESPPSVPETPTTPPETPAAPSVPELNLTTAETAIFAQSEGGSVNFSLDGQTKHKITFDKVSTTSVTLTLFSDPLTLTLNVGESKEVTLDGKKVLITLKGIKDGQAQLEIKKVAAAAPIEQPKPSAPEALTAKTKFRDVKAGHWSEDSVEKLGRFGVMRGISETTFGGDRNTLRGEMAAIVLRSLGEECGEGYSAPFKDVDKSQWYAPCISKAYAKGFFKGDTRGRARPGDSITRAEIITMLFNAFQISLPEAASIQPSTVPFTDFDKTKWWAPYLYLAYQRGFMLGYPDNTIRPDDSATRYEIAVIVARFLNYMVQL